jgi:excisionase family DNA binding protein
MLAGDLLTTKEAAALLRVSPWTISAWLSQGKLPRTKAGGRTLIAKADIEIFIRASSEKHNSAASVSLTTLPPPKTTNCSEVPALVVHVVPLRGPARPEQSTPSRHPAVPGVSTRYRQRNAW